MLLGLLVAWAWPVRTLDVLDRAAFDFAVQEVLADPPGRGDVTVVLLDDESLVRLGENWPLSRITWARFLRTMSAYEPAVIAMDAWFETPAPDDAMNVALDAADGLYDLGLADQPMGSLLANRLERVAQEHDADRQLTEAMAASGRVVLGVVCADVVGDTSKADLPAGLVQLEHTRPLVRTPLRCPTVVGSLPRFTMAARAQGGLTALHDGDNAIRRYPYWFSAGGGTFPSLALAAVQVGRPASFEGLVDTLAERGGGTSLLWQRRRSQIRTVRLSDVLEAPVGTPQLMDALKNQIVFVGVSAKGTQDFVRTSREADLPGVMVHANAALDLLAGRSLQRAGAAARAGAILGGALVLLLGVLGWRVRSAPVQLLMGLGAVVGWGGIATFAFRSGVVFPLMLVWLGIGAWLVVGLTYVYRRGEGDRQRARDVRRAFNQYLAPAVVEELIENPERLKLGGERRTITAFFTDLVGFTALSETLEPAALLELLNECLGTLTDIVLEEGGIVDKYIGDAIVVMFGAPFDQPDHAERACRTALRCQAAMRELRRGWAAEGRPQLYLRIGLNTGPALVGNMGSAQRFDYTMLGDSVNLAARLEGANSAYGTDILVGEGTAALASNVLMREIDSVCLKGKSNAIRVYSPIAMKPRATGAQRRAVEVSDGALAAYRAQDWPAARAGFGRLVAAGDGTAAIFLARVRHFQKAPPGSDWDGVHVMTTK